MIRKWIAKWLVIFIIEALPYFSIIPAFTVSVLATFISMKDGKKKTVLDKVIDLEVKGKNVVQDLRDMDFEDVEKESRY